MQTNRHHHASIRAATSSPRAMLAPTDAELAIRAACQRARDARAAATRRKAAASRRFVLRFALPAWGLCAVVTFAAIVGGM